MKEPRKTVDASNNKRGNKIVIKMLVFAMTALINDDNHNKK